MLTCASCGSENPAGQRFCGSCGSALAASCPSCGASAPAGYKFCGECGSSIAAASPTAAPAAAGASTTERRVCSVLFADLVGFTPLSESRDPEEVRELLSRYFETARTVITRYGGVVEKFIGDAVMAVWGTPVAAEGDAERAVRAGLDLVAGITALGAEIGADGLALRAGIVTGEVAAALGAVGEGMVAGDAVNTAARVQSVATPSTVWVDSPTQRLAGAGIGFRNAGAHALKGKAEPVELWEATRVLSSVGGVQRVDGLEAPMIGREAEDRTLRELFHAGATRRAPRVVTVTGAAGSGKSRLGWEFEKYIDGLADVVAWHRGRCLSYGEGVAYWALAEAVRQRFGIAAEDPVDEATAKFLTGLAEHVPSPEEQSFVGIRLGRLLGLKHPDDTGAALAHDALFAGWRLFFERMADVGPVVLVIEDAQQADDSLLDFVEHVADWARQSPIYLVLLGRTELIERRPELAGGRNRTALTLDPLDDGSMQRLVGALVAGMPDSAVDAIVAQAQGNPLFAVETVRSLIDRDVIIPVEGEYQLVAARFDELGGTLAVPDSLHALLAARLDALDPALRSLVADAAVLGTSFPAEALAVLAGRPADDLRASLIELVRRDVFDVSTDPLSPERGQYVFGQNMLRQVAYETLSRRDRRARHLAVAEHLRRTFTSEGDEIMDVVAQHYLDALAALPDPETDDEIRRWAVDCLVRAAERSLRTGAPSRAGQSYEQAADLVVEVDPRRAAQLLELDGDAMHLAGRIDAGRQAFVRARELYLELGERRAAARALAYVARSLRWLGRMSEGSEAVTEAVAELRTDPDADTAEALSEACSLAVFAGQPLARDLADEAIGLGQALALPDAKMADLFGAKGLADLTFHRRAEAILALRFAAELAERSGALTVQMLTLNNLGAALLPLDPTAAIDVVQRALDVARAGGAARILSVASSTLMFAHLCAGDWNTAEALVEATLADTKDESYFPMAVSLLFVLRGDLERARTLSAGRAMRESADVQEIAVVRCVDAALAAASGAPAQAVEILRPMFDADAEIDLDLEYVFFAWPIALRCAFDVGDHDEARRLVAFLDAQPVGHLPAILRSGRALGRARLAALGGAPEDQIDAAFATAISELRAGQSTYHLAHGLLDHAEWLRGQGQDATALVDEALLIGDRLHAPDIGVRADALGVPAVAAS